MRGCAETGPRDEMALGANLGDDKRPLDYSGSAGLSWAINGGRLSMDRTPSPRHRINARVPLGIALVNVLEHGRAFLPIKSGV